MQETFDTIASWAGETFGPVTNVSIIARANKEMAELLSHVTGTPTDKPLVEEVADVIICLARYPSVWDAIQAKMKVNRARRWRLTGDGCGQHIEDAQ